MKKTIRSLILCALPLSVAIAQEEQPPASPPASSLELSADRTQGERIAFLMDVASAYVNEDDFPAAVDAYERILQIDPAHQQTRHMLSHIYINAKEYQKAETMFFALIEEYPENFTIWNNLAWLYATAEDPKFRSGEKAVKYSREALTLAPTDFHIWSTLAEAYYVSGDYEKAYRAVRHMASLAALYGRNITEESVAEYNEQIRKCKRALDTAETMKAENTTEATKTKESE